MAINRTSVFGKLLTSDEIAGNVEKLTFFQLLYFLSHSRQFWTTKMEIAAVVSMSSALYYVSLWNMIPNQTLYIIGMLTNVVW